MIHLRIEDEQYNKFNYVFDNLENAMAFIEMHMKYCNKDCEYVMEKMSGEVKEDEKQ